MAEKYLKVIQDGVTSFIPDNSKNRTFWAKQNAKLGKSKLAQFEMVTVIPATDEEVAFMNQPVTTPTVIQPTVATSELEKMHAMFALQQEQIAQQQLLINKLLLVDTDKEKVKPGPKPKTNNDGEANQTEGAKQA